VAQFEEVVFGFTNLWLGFTYKAGRINKFQGIQMPPTGLAVVSPGSFRLALGTAPFHIPVRKKTFTIGAVKLLYGFFVYVILLIKV
jgi:hypothetical protein